jgi:hypothetical protein
VAGCGQDDNLEYGKEHISRQISVGKSGCSQTPKRLQPSVRQSSENWDSPRVFHRKYASGATNFSFGNINTFPIQPIWAEGVECEIASSSLSMSSAMVSNIGVDR